jgi:hypothetical protein
MYLWALLFLAAPIIIHLLSRRKTVRLDFSSVRFLRVTAVKASSRRNLKRWLLLLTRLLIIAAVVFLFARPYRPEDRFLALFAPDADVWVWIDPTISMDYGESGATVLARARAAAMRLDSALSGGARGMLYDHAEQRFVELGPAALERAALTRHGPGTIDRALRAINRHRDRFGAGRSCLVVLSDFQEHDLPPLRALMREDTVDMPVLLVNCAPDAPWNYRVSDAEAIGGASEAVRVRISAMRAPLSNGDIAVIVGGMRGGRRRVSLEEGESRMIAMEIGGVSDPAPATVHCEAGDPFIHDNYDFTAVGLGARTRAVILAEGRESFPVAAALSARAAHNAWHAPRTAAPAAFDGEEIDTTEVIVCNDLKTPAPAVRAILGGASYGRKTVVFAPSVQPRFRLWNEKVFSHLAPDQPIEYVRLDEPRSIVLPDTVSSLWRGFPHLRDLDIAVYEYARPIPGEPLLRLSNGDPLATHVVDRHGHSWLIFATPIGVTESNNLAETGFYVPALDRLIQYAAGAVRRGGQPWIAGYSYANPFAGERARARVTDQHGEVVTVWQNQPRVILEEPGVYSIQPEGEAAYLQTVKIDSLEADLTYALPEIGPANRPSVRAMTPGAFARFLEQRQTDPFIRLLWIALAVLLMLEVLLRDNQFRRVKAARSAR